MNTRWLKVALATAGAAVLTACGGGGDGGAAEPAPAPAPAVAAGVPAVYVGTFISPCQQAPDIRNLDVNAGTPVYVRPALTVKAPTGTVAPVELRLDLFQDAACATATLGAIQYGNASQVSFDGAKVVGGATVQQVSLTLDPVTKSFPARAGVTASFGTAQLIVAPVALFTKSTYKDLWLVQGDKMYEGSDRAGADGYPESLDMSTFAARSPG